MSNPRHGPPRDRRVSALRAAVFALVDSMDAVVRVARWPRDEAAPEPLVDSSRKVVERLATTDRFLASRYEGRSVDAASVAALCDAARKLDVAYRCVSDARGGLASRRPRRRRRARAGARDRDGSHRCAVSLDTGELRGKLELALAEVDAAETALAMLLVELRRAPRAEKVTVTEVVEKAFTRLRTGRQELARLRDLLTAEP